MKKVILVISFLILLGACYGCSNEYQPIVEAREEECFLYAATWGGKIIRYDVLAKKASVACPDPQCAHGKDCLVTLIDRLTVSDDYLLYVRGEMSGDAYCYNLRSGTIDKIISAAQASTLYLIDKTVYFSASQYEYNDDGSLRGEVWNVYKYVINSKQLTKISDEALATSVRVTRHTEDTLIWRGDDNTRFSSDYDFKNIVNNLPSQPQTFDGYVYNAETHNHDGMYIYKVVRNSILNSTMETVQDGILSFRWDNPDSPKRLIYMPLGEEALYSVDLATLKKQKLCDIPNGISITDIFAVEGNDYVVGDYIAFYVHNASEEDEEAKLTSESLMFVNVTSGEFFIITP